jgi:hypothetical protein
VKTFREAEQRFLLLFLEKEEYQTVKSNSRLFKVYEYKDLYYFQTLGEADPGGLGASPQENN